MNHIHLSITSHPFQRRTIMVTPVPGASPPLTAARTATTPPVPARSQIPVAIFPSLPMPDTTSAVTPVGAGMASPYEGMEPDNAGTLVIRPTRIAPMPPRDDMSFSSGSEPMTGGLVPVSSATTHSVSPGSMTPPAGIAPSPTSGLPTSPYGLVPQSWDAVSPSGGPVPVTAGSAPAHSGQETPSMDMTASQSGLVSAHPPSTLDVASVNVAMRESLAENLDETEHRRCLSIVPEVCYLFINVCIYICLYLLFIIN